MLNFIGVIQMAGHSKFKNIMHRKGAQMQSEQKSLQDSQKNYK